MVEVEVETTLLPADQCMDSNPISPPSVSDLVKKWEAVTIKEKVARKVAASPRQILELEESLASAHEWLSEIEKKVDYDAMEKTICQRSIDLYVELFKLSYKHDWEDFKVIADQIAQDNGCKITTEYLMALTENGKNTPTEGFNYKSLILLRAFCMNYTDASLEFCAELGRMGAFPLLVDPLKTFFKDLSNEDIRENIILPCMHILHNCAKVPENKRLFEQAATVEAVVPYTKGAESEIKMISMMTLSYIIEEKNNNIILSDGSMIKFILKYLESAIQSSKHRYEGFAAWEIVSGLMHLAGNDSNKTAIVKERILPMLVVLMQTGNEIEKMVCAKTVWVLSFSNENKTKIRDEANMMSVLKKLQSNPGKAKENASGALWELSDERTTKLRGVSKEKLVDAKYESSIASKSASKMPEIDEPLDQSELTSIPKHIMISYQWDCQKLVLQVKERLDKLNYRVWLDVESMEGSTLQAMAEAVENSEAVLICMSQKYKDSPNCRSEAEYAFQLRKTLIPLKVEPMYQPDGWLGVLQGAKLYFDLSDLENFDLVFSKLVKELGNKGKAINVDVMDNPSQLVTKLSTEHVVVEHWSKSRVEEWASSHEIASRKVRSLDGKALIFLHNLKKTAPEFFYKHVSDKLGISDTGDLMNLSQGLDALDL